MDLFCMQVWITFSCHVTCTYPRANMLLIVFTRELDLDNIIQCRSLTVLTVIAISETVWRKKFSTRDKKSDYEHW